MTKRSISPANRRGWKPVARFARMLLIGMCATLAGGCNTTNFSSLNTLDLPEGGGTLLLMPMDVEVNLLTAGGALQPKAEWTTKALDNLSASIDNYALGKGLEFEDYEAPDPSHANYALFNEVISLHGAVGNAILQHKYTVPLPTKKNTFDWSLGPDVRSLPSDSPADYALFIYYRSNYASGGRIFATFAAALVGFPLAGPRKAGFASLVDMRTGDIVWFNYLRGTADDVRDPERADFVVRSLLKGLPSSGT